MSDTYGHWTETFELLHQAAISGAPAEEISRLGAAELDDLATDGHDRPER